MMRGAGVCLNYASSSKRLFLKRSLSLGAFILAGGVLANLNDVGHFLNKHRLKVNFKLFFRDDYAEYLKDSQKWIDSQQLLSVFKDQSSKGKLLKYSIAVREEFLEVELLFSSYKSYLECDLEYDAITNHQLRSSLGYSVRTNVTFV